MASENGGVTNVGTGSTALGLAFFLTVLFIMLLVLGAALYLKTGGF